MDDLTGQIIKSYELRKQVGSGGFGAVYLAYQAAVNREVAIKVILPEYANEADFIRRFESEAQLIARLEHPFIVPLFDYWREPNRAYLVMRLLRGGSLRSLLANGPLETDVIVRIVEQIGSALSIAHRNGIVHRDLKPDNILLDQDGNAYLTDFGIAKRFAEGPFPGNLGELDETDDADESITGSPYYISPEQIMIQPVSPQTDIYAFGMVLYEMLTGEQPYAAVANTLTALFVKQMQEPLPDVRTRRPGLPFPLNSVVQVATAKAPEDRYPNVLALVQAVRTAFSDNVYVEEFVELSSAVNPFKGLRPFEEADAADFFGRTALIDRLLEVLQVNDPLARFLAVVGPSGSGKSSVVKAGLIPALRQGRVPDSDGWFIAEMVPGAQPLEKLEAALLSVASTAQVDLTGLLQNDEQGLLKAAEALLPPDEQLLLFIDQFEEVFTLLQNEAERIHFLALVASAVTTPGSRVRIIVTLRADFYDRPLLYEGFGTLMSARTEVVLPLSTAELELAIDGPANRVGLFIDPNLLETIVADVRDEPGALPLLQHLLTELFERRDGNHLTLDAYRASGGVMGALARRAEEIYSGLPADQQTLTRQLFLRLVTLGEGTEDTRRRVHQAELIALVRDADAMQTVLNTFGRYRLLSFDYDPATREPTVEVAHEALIRQWSRLREWLNGSRADLRQERLLAGAAAEWRTARNDPSFLLSGVRLSQFEEWSAFTDLALTQEEAAYLKASISRRQTEQDAEAQRKAREALLERRSRIRLRALAIVMAVAAVIALGLTAFAFDERSKAVVARVTSEYNQNVAQTQAAIATHAQGEAIVQANNAATAAVVAQRRADEVQSLRLSDQAMQAVMNDKPDLALILALESNRIATPTAQTERTLAEVAYLPGLRRQLVGHTAQVSDVAFSPDGKTALSASNDSTLILWDLATGQKLRMLTGHSLIVTSVVFSPDGKTALSGSWDRTFIQWDVATGKLLRRFEVHTGAVTGVAFTPDGLKALSSSVDGVVLTDLASGQTLRTFINISAVSSLAISPDGKSVLAGSQDNSLTLFDIATGQPVQKFKGHTSAVTKVAFSPDGKTLLSGSTDTSIILWDVQSGVVLHTYLGHSLAVRGIAFSPDGKTFLSSADDGIVILSDVQSGGALYQFQEPKISSLAFSPDGHMALFGDANGGLNLWNIKIGPEAWDYTFQGEVSRAAFTPDGKQALVSSKGKTLALWDVATGTRVRNFETYPSPIESLAISPDGKLALTGSDDSKVVLWNMSSGAPVRTFSGHSMQVNDVAFGPDGKTAVSGSEDSSLIVWDVTTGKALHTLTGHTRRVLSVAYSPDGKTILSGGADRLAILWDAVTGKPLHMLPGHTRRVVGVAYSPDSKMALTGSDDKTLFLWNLDTGQVIHPFNNNTEPISSVAFNPDGKTVLTGSESGSVILWDVQTGSILRQFSGHSNLVLSLAFSPDGRLALSGSRDNTLRLWYTPPLDALIQWIHDNYQVRDFTCDERQTYSIIPLCSERAATQPGITPTPTPTLTSAPTATRTVLPAQPVVAPSKTAVPTTITILKVEQR